ncbi:MAG: DEAD/DEAH box helicase [Deltaproteobacteria bacterium]|nr:DEAD/DEAH box helicase [Deltaproteobacteria bacterium]
MNSKNNESSLLEESADNALESFKSFNLKTEIQSALNTMNFEKPTPVQSRCFESSISGIDAIIMAQTGTGKTAAFGIPIVQKINEQKSGIQAMVLVPTRELALQVSKEITAIGANLKFDCVPVYGGASFSEQANQLKNNAAIVVGTPGRVLDHLRRRTLDLNNLNTFVLDEADEMLSMGFERELSEIMENLPEKRQTLLFSATMPDDIKRLSGKYLKDPVTISVSGDQVGASQISHYVYLVSGLGRVKDLIKLLDIERPGSAIIFCNTKDETQLVCAGLKNEGLNATFISSDLSQNERERVMNATREGKIKYLVATDVAARGIDISHLSHVINFSFPESLEKYIHRTGRTGRQGRHGAAVSLITPQDIGNLYMLRLTYKIFPVEKDLPTSTQIDLKNELDSFDKLVNDFNLAIVGENYLNLSDRIINSVYGRHIVAALVEGYSNGKITFKKDIEQTIYKDNKNIDDTRHAKNKPIDRPQVKKHWEKKEKVVNPPEKAVNQQEKSPARDSKENTSKTSEVVESQPKEISKDLKNANSKNEILNDAKNLEIPPPEVIISERSSIVPDLNNPEGTTDIYIDAGRKDGLRISALMKDIVENTNLPRGEIGKVRMLSRSTFLTVPNRSCDAVFQIIKNIKVDGRVLKPEYTEES